MVESEEWIRCCLQKNGAYIDHPFGLDSTVIKVEGRIFAQLFTLKGQESMTLNCEMMTGQFYRSLHPGIIVRGIPLSACAAALLQYVPARRYGSR